VPLDFKGKSVLVTGASGFVGSYLVKHLLSEGAEVFGLVRRRADGAVPKNIVDRGISEEVNLVEADLDDITSLAFALDESVPDYIFHLAAQSFVHRSFTHPLETAQANCLGTANLLEAVRYKDFDPVLVFAGSSEEYGLVIASQAHLERARKKYGVVTPEPARIPELPIAETNPLRPMSPYAVSKVYGEYLARNYFHSYGMRVRLSRGFNHEGAGRGIMFVTSVIASQVQQLAAGAIQQIRIGDVNSFRDWSHVNDVVRGYCLLAHKGRDGEVYNQGSMRTHSIAGYILLALNQAGYDVERLSTVKGGKVVEDPAAPDEGEFFGIRYPKTKVDALLLAEKLHFDLADEGLVLDTAKGKVRVVFDEKRFRPADVPILLSDTRRIQQIGFEVRHPLEDVIRDQLNFYLNQKNWQ